MPKSKLRKNHSQKLKNRRTKLSKKISDIVKKQKEEQMAFIEELKAKYNLSQRVEETIQEVSIYGNEEE